MENIQSTHATFEQAKLLKEKEWQQRTKMVWLDSLGKQYLREVHLSLELNNAEYDAPEQWQVVEWLRINHGIWVYVKLGFGYEFVIQKTAVPFEIIYTDGTFKSSQEAYSAAFDYILKKLI